MGREKCLWVPIFLTKIYKENAVKYLKLLWLPGFLLVPHSSTEPHKPLHHKLKVLITILHILKRRDADEVVLASLTPQSEEMPLLGPSVCLKILLSSPLSNLSCSTVFIPSDRLQVQGPAGHPWAPTQGAPSSYQTALCPTAVRRPVLQLASPISLGRGSFHLMTRRKPGQSSKPGTGVPRDQMDKEEQ